MSAVGSSTTWGTPSAFLSLRSAAAAGRKSATAAAMTTMSQSSARASTACSISAAVSTRTTSTPAADGRGVVVTSVTFAPRAAASSASAWPCLPEDRLPMKRTGSIGSRVPPAVTSTRSPARSGSVSARSTAATIVAGSARRPAPTVAPGQASLFGRHEVHAAAGKHAQVVLHSRVLPHLGVHGRADHDGRASGEQRGGEEVVRDPRGVGADEPGGGRAPRPRRRRPARCACAGSGRRRRTARCGPARTPAPRTWCGRRTVRRLRSAPASRARRRRRGGGRPRLPCRRRSRPVTPRTTRRPSRRDIESATRSGRFSSSSVRSGSSGGTMPSILAAAISSKAIDRGLRATDVTCGGMIAPRPSPSWPKYELICRARFAPSVTRENLDPARSRSSSIGGVIIVSWRQAGMGEVAPSGREWWAGDATSRGRASPNCPPSGPIVCPNGH